MARKDFFKKLQKSKEAFEEGRKGRGGGMIEVGDGKYIVRAQSMELDVNDAGHPYVQINSIVVNSENESDFGARVGYRKDIVYRSGKYKQDNPVGKKGEKWEMTEADAFADICTALQSFGVETSDKELEDLAEVADVLAEEQPACRIEVKTKSSGWTDIKWGKPVDDADLPSIEDVIDDEEDEDEDDVEDEEDDVEDDEYSEEDEDEDEDDEDSPPEKGEEVVAKPTGTRKPEKFIVTNVNVKAETCSLKRERDKKLFKSQSWDVIVG